MVKGRRAEIPVIESSGNVFADMGLPEAEEELTKAQLASHIRQVIKRQRLTQVAAAAVMGIDQPKVSALLNRRLANFSGDRLMPLLTALGHDVEIKTAHQGLSDPARSCPPRCRSPGKPRRSHPDPAALASAAGNRRRSLSTTFQSCQSNYNGCSLSLDNAVIGRMSD